MDQEFKFSPSVIALPLLFVLALWISFWVEVRFHLDFSDNGILPRTFFGLQGIIFSPFIHGNLEHLYNNSIPLLILLVALRFFYRKQSLSILGYGILLTGLLTWIIGRGNYHIGASGLIYLLVSLIFFKGIQTKYYRLVALSLTVIVMYGGMVWYLFPSTDQTISWEGHLSGFITGLVFSLLYKTPEYHRPIVYFWEQPDFDPMNDPFMKRFDEYGNFKNPPKPEEVVDEITFNATAPVQYVYVFKATDEDSVAK